MKRLFALIVATVMCFVLCACDKENDTASAAEEFVNTENKSVSTSDYASVLTDMLCSGKWVGESTGEKLIFNADGTCTWFSDEGNKEWTWCYYTHYDSSFDIPIPVAAAFSKDSSVYWGEFPDVDVSEYHGHDGMMIGYNEEGTLIMSFDGQSWTIEE